MARGFPDWSGPKVGVYLQPEWAAKEGTDKNFVAGNSAADFAEVASIVYDVPAPKTLYITQLTASLNATEKPFTVVVQPILVLLQTVALGVILSIGGAPGVGMTFPKPITIEGGDELVATVANVGNLVSIIRITVGGYEI